MKDKLPKNAHLDYIVASLVVRPYMAENIPKDVADTKVDYSVMKAYVAAHLALLAGVYGAYVAHSLLTDFGHLPA
ncbi:hypothetical protein NDU88_002836 [Pleurodeles waltl]|uniref:Uncharacterized protein n=1 Tax=Pleurodeles waltl TaxID=8319 RepID=A0AAV7QA12_PLEWA|nr:hypothetical protein NDU88_002836 [Pleurodeles waltl]